MVIVSFSILICYNQDWLPFEYLISELSCAVSFEGKLKEPELFSDSWIEYFTFSLFAPPYLTLVSLICVLLLLILDISS